MNAAVPTAALQAAAAETLTLLVRSIRMEAEGIHAFELVDPDGGDLPETEAGAHVDVHLPGGLVRSYSLAGDPQDRKRWLLGVLREPKSRGGSRAMHEQVRVGQRLTIGRPRQAFALKPGTGRALLLAGGIGITPLKAMAHALSAAGKPFDLHYCARSPKHAAFVEALKAVTPQGHLHLHFDDGDPSQGLDIAALLKQPEPGTQVYYCGPGGFMQACALATTHWPAGTVHCEHFKAPEPSASALPAGSFQVHLSKQGMSLQVAPDQTIVRAIELAGLRVPTSCLSGLCGACKVNYLEGEVEHNDYILTDEEKAHCLTVCVSRARSPRLVLDL
jgi:vanillate O-demethylase ferredoxin subunit